jgi:diguanylate cyclase (GGDEF)-like protein/PAS domain S-box-containing protein
VVIPAYNPLSQPVSADPSPLKVEAHTSLRQLIAALAAEEKSYALVYENNQLSGILLAADAIYWIADNLDLERTSAQRVIRSLEGLPQYPVSKTYDQLLEKQAADVLPLINRSGDLVAVLKAEVIYEFTAPKGSLQRSQTPTMDRQDALLGVTSPSRASCGHLQYALLGARMGIWMWSLDQPILTWSAETERLFGIPPGSFDGRFQTFLSLIHPEDREDVSQDIEAALHSQQPFTSNFRLPQANGSDRWLALRAKVFGGRNQDRQMAGIVMDITNQKKLETELKLQNQRERLIGELAQQIQQLPDLNSVLERTVIAVHQLTQANRVVVVKYGNDSSCQVLKESCDEAYKSMLDWVIREPWAVEEKYVKRYQEGRGLAVEDVYSQRLQPNHLEFLEYFQVKAAVIVPFLQDKSLWGLMIVHQCDNIRYWNTSTVRLLQNLATQVSIALQQNKLHAELRRANTELTRMAYLDGLTQVANRRRFEQYIQQEWKRSARENTSIALIMCDIDYFKGFNDLYGHHQGDVCLQRVSKAIARAVQRPADLVARYGGEEFVVILPNTNLIGAEQVAENIRIAVRRLRIPHAASASATIVTLSCGVAAVVASIGSSIQNLIEGADKALYQAKNNGRDQVAITPEVPS